MLRRDFGDYLEFMQKIQEADEEETKNSAKNVRRCIQIRFRML